MNYSKDWRKLTGMVATPTIILWAFGLATYLISMGFGLLNENPNYWVLGMVNFVAFYLLFTPLHEAIHGNIKGKNKNLKKLEDFIGWTSAGVLFIINFPFMKFDHLRHHSHVNDQEKDPDYWVATNNPFKLLARTYTIIFSYLYQFFGKGVFEMWNTPSLRRMCYWILFGFAFQLSIFFGLVYFFGFMKILYLIIIPGFSAYAFLAFVFDWLPHYPYRSQERYKDTRIIKMPLLNTLLLGQNYHLIHHLYPNIPYYSYEKAYGIMEQELRDHGALIQEPLKK